MGNDYEVKIFQEFFFKKKIEEKKNVQDKQAATIFFTNIADCVTWAEAIGSVLGLNDIHVEWAGTKLTPAGSSLPEVLNFNIDHMNRRGKKGILYLFK